MSLVREPNLDESRLHRERSRRTIMACLMNRREPTPAPDFVAERATNASGSRRDFSAALAGHAAAQSAAPESDADAGFLGLGLCVQSRPKAAKDAPLQRMVPKRLPPGLSATSPAAKYLMYDDAPTPGMPAPISPAPFLARRYSGRTMQQLAREHEGEAEPLAGPASRKVAASHMQDGWSAENLERFRQNELLCQVPKPPTRTPRAHTPHAALHLARKMSELPARSPLSHRQSLFGADWDPRYGRSRVRSSETGELICWGDGDTYTDAELVDGVDDAPLNKPHVDGAELRRVLRERSRTEGAGLPPKPQQGRRHMVGHPMGAPVHKQSDGYYRWLQREPHGIDIDEAIKRAK